MTFGGGERGQASVEFVGVLPLLVVLCGVLWQAAVAGQAVWLSAPRRGRRPAPRPSAGIPAGPRATRCPDVSSTACASPPGARAGSGWCSKFPRCWRAER